MAQPVATSSDWTASDRLTKNGIAGNASYEFARNAGNGIAGNAVNGTGSDLDDSTSCKRSKRCTSLRALCEWSLSSRNACEWSLFSSIHEIAIFASACYASG